MTIPGLNEQLRVIDGTAQRELDAARTKVLHDVDMRARDRRELRNIVNSMLQDDGSGVPVPLQGFTRIERNNPFCAQAVRFQIGGTNEDFTLLKETNAALRKYYSYLPDHGGLLVPMQVRASGNDTKGNVSGDYLVSDRVLDLVALLRAKCVALRMGATLLGGLNSSASIPLQSAGTTGAFVPENPGTDITQTDSSFGSIALTPRTVQGTTAYSKQLLQQSSVDIESFIKSDLASTHAAVIDQACFSGTGSSNQPIGLKNHANVPVVALGSDGLAPTAAALCSLEASIADNSADLGTLAWITTPTMRSKLRQTPLFTNATVPCWTGVDGADQLLGSPAAVSKSVPSGLAKGANNDCHCIILGYWPALVVASWGVMELTFDPYAQKRRGMIEISSYQAIDIAVRRPTAFAMILDARNV